MNPPGGIPNPQGGTPPEDTRFSATNQPNNPGRTSTAWLRTKLSKAMKDRDVSAREAIADHLIEIATSYEVVIKGRGEDAIPLASAKDSIEAAKVLYAYDMGKPVESLEVKQNTAPKVLTYLPKKGSVPPGLPPAGSDDGSGAGG